MGKLDKKVLKFLTARQEIDLDAGDIAIDLRCDEDVVQEALDSLKVQGLVESVERNGRLFWQVSSGSPPAEEPEMFEETPAPKRPTPTRDPDSETVSFDLTDIKSQAKNAPQPQVKKTAAPQPYVAPSKPYIDKDDDLPDVDDVDEPVAASGVPIMAISVAVVISVVISAIIAVLVASGSKTSVSEGILALERSSAAAQAKADQRIDELSAQVKALSEKSGGGQQPPASVSVAAPAAPATVEKHMVKPPPKQAARVAAKRASKSVVKAAHAAPKKKKDKSGAPSYFNPPEESSSSSSSSSAASSDAGASSSSPSSSTDESSSSSSSAPSSSDQGGSSSSGSGDNAGGSSDAGSSGGGN